jgi:DNA-binding IclR family transcriptional regulator
MTGSTARRLENGEQPLETATSATGERRGDTNALLGVRGALELLKVIGESRRALTAVDLTYAIYRSRRPADRRRVLRQLAELRDAGVVQLVDDHKYVLGVALAGLAWRVGGGIIEVAEPLMRELIRDYRQWRVTALLGQAATHRRTGGEECHVIHVIRPVEAHELIPRAPGDHRPITETALGGAILAGRDQQPGEPPAIADARATGWAVTADEVGPELTEVAVPLNGPIPGGEVYQSLSLVSHSKVVGNRPDQLPLDRIGRRLREVAEQIGEIILRR